MCVPGSAADIARRSKIDGGDRRRRARERTRNESQTSKRKSRNTQPVVLDKQNARGYPSHFAHGAAAGVHTAGRTIRNCASGRWRPSNVATTLTVAFVFTFRGPTSSVLPKGKAVSSMCTWRCAEMAGKRCVGRRNRTVSDKVHFLWFGSGQCKEKIEFKVFRANIVSYKNENLYV